MNRQSISPARNMTLVVEEFDGGEFELTVFQVEADVFQIFDVDAGNRWADTKFAGNNNWTFDDYAEMIDSSTITLVKIIKGDEVYEREVLH